MELRQADFEAKVQRFYTRCMAVQRGSSTSDIKSGKNRARVVIEAVRPSVDAGKYPIKRCVGEFVDVEADVFGDGHDAVQCVLLHRREGETGWNEVPMKALGNDAWTARFEVPELGRYVYTVQAWVDHYESWRHGILKKITANADTDVDYKVGAALMDGVGSGQVAESCRAWAAELLDPAVGLARKRDLASSMLVGQTVSGHRDRQDAVIYEPELKVMADSPLARFSAWYEFFPRSCSPAMGKHGTFREAEAMLDYVAGMGFDVVYLPPIHPVGREFRKGKNNSVVCGPGDVGSPWAIGASEGGHKSILPELGTMEDFRHFRDEARSKGLALALDIAFQCAPDHPYVREHPEWYLHRPDGTIQYAENPPKKYQDIYPFDFENGHWAQLWEELKSVFLFWIEEGVRIFRVDNPHTKPFHFWEWLIGDIQRDFPDTVFLSEAFTRPKVMNRLAKLGFSQSYNYFPWRNSKHELTEYLTELTQTRVREFFRPSLWPNTPDILTQYLQFGGRSAFVTRFILASTLGASYGIYGPAFELCENTPREPGSEEYLNSEKYELKQWDLQAPHGLRDLIARVNQIRKEHVALHHDWSLRFHDVDNEELICYSKTAHDPRQAEEADTILVVVNLDPHYTQSGWVHLNVAELELPADSSYQVHDVLTGETYLWHGARNYVELNPHATPAHIFRIRRWVRTETQFEQYM